MTAIRYPDTRMEAQWDTLAGVSFPDPYRWLEQDSEEVQRWQRAQAALATSYATSWARFEELRRWVEKFTTERYVTLPRFAGGKWFFTAATTGTSPARALVSEEPTGGGRVLFDPKAEGESAVLSWIEPSPDGRTLALGVCTDGSEGNTIRLIDAASGKWLSDPPTHTLMDSWTGGVQWLPDSSGFFFSALAGRAIDFDQRVYLHRRSPTPVTAIVEAGWSIAKDYRMVVVSSDRRHAVAVECLQSPTPIAFASLGNDPLQWRPFLTAAVDTIAGHAVGDRYIAVTTVGATRGRVVAIPFDSADPNDAAQWQELVPESEATVRTLTPVGQWLYLTEFINTYARVRIVDLCGRWIGEVALPGHGAIVSELPFPMMNLTPRGHPAKFLFGFSSLTTSPAIYSHTPGEAGIDTIRTSQVTLENVVVEDRWATSADGTRVPYHLVRRSEAGVPRATMIYGYGGYNYPLIPAFPGPMAAFIAMGGNFVHANLRGGAEFGLEWWQNGRMGKKQNAYDDLYAIAEDLIASKICSPQLLGVTGSSNGGLLAAVAATQRPELWAVAVPRVPVLDLIGACREPYGKQAIQEEMANVEDPQEVRRLASFSPYQLARDGVRYPAIFIEAGATDPRCPPWHARKFAARLQKANGGNNPAFVHVWENAGHGWATDKNVMIAQNTEWLVFALRHLGCT
jgi:prolyl oligopeptidase